MAPPTTTGAAISASVGILGTLGTTTFGPGVITSPVLPTPVMSMFGTSA